LIAALGIVFSFSSPAFAKPAPASPKTEVSGLTVYTGGRAQLDAKIPGGTWFWDEGAVELTQNDEGAVVKALKEGSTRVRYTYGWGDQQFNLTILASALPQTGQDYTPVWALAGVAAFLLAAGLLRRKWKKA